MIIFFMMSSQFCNVSPWVDFLKMAIFRDTRLAIMHFLSISCDEMNRTSLIRSKIQLKNDFDKIIFDTMTTFDLIAKAYNLAGKCALLFLTFRYLFFFMLGKSLCHYFQIILYLQYCNIPVYVYLSPIIKSIMDLFFISWQYKGKTNYLFQPFLSE